MTWDYRVISYNHKDGVYYEIHEVYYDDKGGLTVYGGVASGVNGETLKDIEQAIKNMSEALNKPVLSLDDFK